MFEVKSAYVTSAEACVQFLRENETSLILLDINLGNTSGFDLCKKLRQTTTDSHSCLLVRVLAMMIF